MRQSCSPMRSCQGLVFSLCSNITTSSSRQVIIPLLRGRGKPQEASYWTSPGAWVGGFAARGLEPFPVYWVCTGSLPPPDIMRTWSLAWGVVRT